MNLLKLVENWVSTIHCQLIRLLRLHNDFGNAPVSFVEYDEVKEKVTPIYKINRFKPAAKKELNYYIIQSEMFGIIGTGLTEDDAEKSFAEEFDFMYNKLNSLDVNSLTNHNNLIKYYYANR